MCFSFKLWCYLCTPIQFTHFSNRLHSVHCVAPDNHWRPTAARLWEDGDPCSGWKQGMLTLLIFYHFSINKHETIEYRLPLMTLVEKWLGDRRLWLPMLSFLPRKRLDKLFDQSTMQLCAQRDIFIIIRWRMSYWTILFRLMVPVLLCA